MLAAPGPRDLAGSVSRRRSPCSVRFRCPHPRLLPRKPSDRGSPVPFRTGPPQPGPSPSACRSAPQRASMWAPRVTRPRPFRTGSRNSSSRTRPARKPPRPGAPPSAQLRAVKRSREEIRGGNAGPARGRGAARALRFVRRPPGGKAGSAATGGRPGTTSRRRPGRGKAAIIHAARQRPRRQTAGRQGSGRQPLRQRPGRQPCNNGPAARTGAATPPYEGTGGAPGTGHQPHALRPHTPATRAPQHGAQGIGRTRRYPRRPTRWVSASRRRRGRRSPTPARPPRRCCRRELRRGPRSR